MLPSVATASAGFFSQNVDLQLKNRIIELLQSYGVTHNVAIQLDKMKNQVIVYIDNIQDIPMTTKFRIKKELDKLSQTYPDIPAVALSYLPFPDESVLTLS